MTATPDQSSSSICVGCGLCCDGTLHGRATVRTDDEANVIAAGLEVEAEGEKRFFRQPCPRFSCGSCTIYFKRPQVCRRYRCELLKSLEAGEIPEADARDKIATAKGLIGAVRAIDPTAVTPGERTALAKRLTVELGQLEGSERDAKAKALLDTAILEHFLNRWFLDQDKEKKGRAGSRADES